MAKQLLLKWNAKVFSITCHTQHHISALIKYIALCVDMLDLLKVVWVCPKHRAHVSYVSKRNTENLPLALCVSSQRIKLTVSSIGETATYI